MSLRKIALRKCKGDDKEAVEQEKVEGQRKKGMPMKIWMQQIEEKSMKVIQSREDAHYRTR